MTLTLILLAYVASMMPFIMAKKMAENNENNTATEAEGYVLILLIIIIIVPFIVIRFGIDDKVKSWFTGKNW